MTCWICESDYQTENYQQFCPQCMEGMTHYMRQFLLSYKQLAVAISSLAQSIKDSQLKGDITVRNRY